MKKFFEEFKKFIARGNVMDMAVGIIIGGAFTSIVNSLVNDIINPLLGLFGGMNFAQLQWNITGDVILYYGNFITAIINFLRGNDSGQYFDLTTEEMSKDHIREAEGIALAIPVSE